MEKSPLYSRSAQHLATGDQGEKNLRAATTCVFAAQAVAPLERSS